MKELWKNIPGYEGFYQISSKGRIRSLTRKVPTTRVNETYRTIKGHILKATDNIDHYYQITLSKRGKHKNNYLIQDLVAKTFLPNPKHLKCVNHKDENRHNNNVNNLEYCTVKYNDNYGQHKNRIIRHWKEHASDNAIIVGHGIAKVFISMNQAAKYVSNNYGGKTTTIEAHFLNIASKRSKRRHTKGFMVAWYNLPITKKNIKLKVQLMKESEKEIKNKLVRKKSPRIKVTKGSFIKVFSTANAVKDWLLKNKYANCKPVSVRNAVTACCRKKRKHAYGFKFEYIK